jgi:metal-responsive CopG/Arc/MetJ family transcriptional regulator
VFQLPRETVAMLDELKERQGLRSRSQALLQLIDQGRAAIQQQST